MLRKVSLFLASSVMARVFSGIAGLLLARWMPVGDYAIFTVMSTLLGALVILTQGGVQLAVSAQIGRHWPDRARVASVLAAGLAERRIVSAVVLPFLLGGGAWLFMRNHASWPMVALLLVLLLAQWKCDMLTSVIDQVLLFADRANVLQFIEVALNGLRLLAVMALFALGGLNLVGAALLGVGGALLRVPLVRRRVAEEVTDLSVAPRAEDRAEIRAVTLRQLPLEVFYVFQAQIVLAILALHSSAFGTAAFGALGKVDQFLLPTQALFAAFAVPRFSARREGLLRTWLTLSVIGALPGIGLVLVAWLFPALVLFFIGPHYAHLTHEVLASSANAAATVAAYNAWQLLANRGWNHWSWLQVPIVLGWCLLGPKLFDFATLSGVLWFRAGFPLGLGVAVLVELYAAWRGGRLGAADRRAGLT